MSNQLAPTRDSRLVLRIDTPLIERLNRIAAERFEGNRSLLVRQALRELIEKYEKEGKVAA